MSKKLWQIGFFVSVVVYTTIHFMPAGNGFEFSVAKHRDEAQQAQWLVKMSAGTFTMNFSWNP